MVNRLKSLWTPKAKSSPDEARALPRASSLPFISGDTFRAVSPVIVENGEVSRQFGLDTNAIFSDTYSATQENFVDIIAKAISTLDQSVETTLIIHNGDHNFEPQALREFHELVPRIWATNIVVESPGIKAIPIGLENSFRDKNGRLGPFLDALREPVATPARTRMVLSSFHESTNLAIRGQVKSVMSGSRFGHENEFRRRSDYRNEVQHTKFVISPPGNGMDCHRTWEAIYFGAVPVVLKGFLAESLTSDLPIHVVERYEDFVTLSDSELDDLYDNLRSRPLTKAWGHYWLGQILG